MTTAVLETLVGEGKKYQTPEQLAAGKLEADRHIEILNAQLQALKDQAASGSSVSAQAIETILAEIKQSKTSGQPTNTSSEPSNQSGTPLTEAQIVKLVERQHEKAQQDVKRSQTLGEVNRVYGAKSDEFLAKVAADTGYTLDQLKELAGTQPGAFLRLANLGQTRNQASGNSMGNVNTQALTSTSTTDGSVRNKAYYDAKRVEMGAKKFAFDSGLQIQMHRDMQNLGDSWDS